MNHNSIIRRTSLSRKHARELILHHPHEEKKPLYPYYKKNLVITVAVAVCLHLSSPFIPLKYTSRILYTNIPDKQGCVRNVLIDKLPQDEFMPPKHDEASRQVITGTLMSEYEGKVITRFITSVAGVYRSKKSIQHLIFTGMENGRYLGNIGSLSWPVKRRGVEEKVILHLITNYETDVQIDIYRHVTEDKMGKDVRIHNLNKMDRLLYDDTISQEIDELFELDQYMKEIPDISSLITHSSEETVIPYFHVGGQRMDNQLVILQGAVPLFLNQTIVTVGIEHSIDMDIDALLHFFNAINYKTYFLGKNHLVRIDNLCTSTLHHILQRPEFKQYDSFYTAPAFYIAIAANRFEVESRAIENTYNMLGVYSSLPTNAQDRSRERYSSLFSSLLRGGNDLFSDRQRIFTESD